MVKVREDLTGKRFGKLCVIGQTEDYIKNGIPYAQWLCSCDCEPNKTCIRTTQYLKNTKTPSCGCHRKYLLMLHVESCKKINDYNCNGEFGIGYCSNTGREFYFDLEDYDKIKDYCWMEHTNKDGYKSLRTSVYENNKQRAVKMSELILGFKKCDHKDRNPFNNRKSNLRYATAKENSRNRGIRSDNKSGVTGVWWDKRVSKYYVYIRVDGKLLSLGHYIDKTEAIMIRLKAEKEYFGEFAPQKHLFDEYGVA